MELTTPIRFEPVGNVTNVFFDERNEQVFSVRSGGATGILVRSPLESHSSNFITEDKGALLSIKLSPDQRILSYQRFQNSVEFINVNRSGLNGALDEKGEYSQSSRGKNNTILGFAWSNNAEILFVTESGIELYAVLRERKILKNIRTQSLVADWFTYDPNSSLLLLSHSSSSTTLFSFLIQNSYIYKVSKNEIESLAPLRLQDVFICPAHSSNSSYFIGVFVHNESFGLTIQLYSVNTKDYSSVTKAHICQIGLGTPFPSVQFLDGLILVHHSTSKRTDLFDVSLQDSLNGTLRFHEPLTTFSTPELTSSSRIIFTSKCILDVESGLFWKIKLKLPLIISEIEDKGTVVRFLLHRVGAKLLLLDEILSFSESLSLKALGELFDIVNAEYRRYLDIQMQSKLSIPSHFRSLPDLPSPSEIILDQSEFYINVFSKYIEDKLSLKRQTGIVLEYFRSLSLFKIPVSQYLNEFLIKLYVQRSSWYQLHQCLTYHVIGDSKATSCLLLSLGTVYPPARQLALDMCYRLGNARDEMCEILLSRHLVYPALKYASLNRLDSVPPRKFLLSALDLPNKSVFYSIYKYFGRIRGKEDFTPADRYQNFTEKFEEIFPTSEKTQDLN